MPLDRLAFKLCMEKMTESLKTAAAVGRDYGIYITQQVVQSDSIKPGF